MDFVPPLFEITRGTLEKVKSRVLQKNVNKTQQNV